MKSIIKTRSAKRVRGMKSTGFARRIAGVIALLFIIVVFANGAFAADNGGTADVDNDTVKDKASYISDENGKIPGVSGVVPKSGNGAETTAAITTMTEFVDKANSASSIDVESAPSNESFAYRFSEDETGDETEETAPVKTGPDYSLMWHDELNKYFSDDYYYGKMEELGFLRQDVSDQSINRRNAIIRLQSSINQPITGTLDLATKKALIEGGGVMGYDQVNEAPTSEFWVTINKSTRILTVYEGSKVHKKYPVAVGKTMSLTPDGKFTFVTKSVYPAWGGGGYAKPVAGGSPSNPLGPRWLGLSIGGGGRYGLHGNANARSIGTYASHGCIRMINQDVIELYDYIPVGTRVWIGTTEKLNSYGVYQSMYDPLSGEAAPEPVPEEPEPEPVREDLAVMIEELDGEQAA